MLTTFLGLALFTLIGIGVRLLVMMTIQRRQQRMNRQINERLKTLIAAYKVLGGSFTGDLSVDPAHRRGARPPEPIAESPPEDGLVLTVEEAAEDGPAPVEDSGADRRRRIRDAVEAALSDIILLGTEEQVRLASRAASELVAGRPVHTGELVVSLRDFIRQALDLEPLSPDIVIPAQGPTRPQSPAGGRGGGARGGADSETRGGAGGGGSAGGGGMGMGLGMGLGAGRADDTIAPNVPRLER